MNDLFATALVGAVISTVGYLISGLIKKTHDSKMRLFRFSDNQGREQKILFENGSKEELFKAIEKELKMEAFISGVLNEIGRSNKTLKISSGEISDFIIESKSGRIAIEVKPSLHNVPNDFYKVIERDNYAFDKIFLIVDEDDSAKERPVSSKIKLIHFVNDRKALESRLRKEISEVSVSSAGAISAA